MQTGTVDETAKRPIDAQLGILPRQPARLIGREEERATARDQMLSAAVALPD